MIEFLRDTIWQFIGVIAALIAIIVSIVLFYKQRKKKSLSYEILSNNPIVTINDKFSSDLEILYKNKHVKDLYLIILKIKNNGTIPIQSNDFNTNLTISFKNDKTKLLSAEIIETIPVDLNITHVYTQNDIEVKPTLLNSQDSFLFKLLVDNFTMDIILNGRIVGINKINKVKRHQLPYFWIGCLSGILTISGIYLLSINLIIGIIILLIDIAIIYLTFKSLFKRN